MERKSFYERTRWKKAVSMEFTTDLWDALSSNPTLDNDLLNKILIFLFPFKKRE
jgi:hypothetical protein